MPTNESSSSSSDGSGSSSGGDSEELYEISCLLKKRVVSITGVVEYLVHWDGYPRSEATWEPAEKLKEDGNLDMIQAFERELQATKSPQVKAATRELFDKMRARRRAAAAAQANPVAPPQLTATTLHGSVGEESEGAEDGGLEIDVRSSAGSSSGDAKAVPSGQPQVTAATPAPLPNGQHTRAPLDPKDFCTPREPSPVNKGPMNLPLPASDVEVEMQTKKKLAHRARKRSLSEDGMARASSKKPKTMLFSASQKTSTENAKQLRQVPLSGRSPLKAQRLLQHSYLKKKGKSNRPKPVTSRSKFHKSPLKSNPTGTSYLKTSGSVGKSLF